MIARIVLALVAVFSGVMLATDTVADEARGLEALTVDVAQATPARWQQRVQAAGSIRPWHEAHLAAEIGGATVVRVDFDVGDRVKRGQVLLTLSDDILQSEIVEQEARLAQSEAALEEARADARRSRSVSGAGALSDQQAEQYRLRERSAAAERDAVAARLAGLRVRLRKTEVVAPDDGIISERVAVLGQVVQSGTPLGRMIRQGRLEWFTEVTLEQLPQVKVGQEAFMLLPGGAPVTGRVRLIHPQLTVGALVGNVVIELPVDARLQAGYLAYGFINTGEREVLSIPQTAVSWRDGKSHVFQVDPEDRVMQRRVTLGQTRDDRVEVLDGLVAGDSVVVAGAAFLSDGDRIRRRGSATP